MNRYLVAGCGYLGFRVASILANRDAEVFAIRATGTNFPSNVRGITTELGTGTLEELGQFDGIVYCVAAQDSTEEGYRHAYIDSLKEILSKTSGERTVFVSSTAVYPTKSEETLHETSAPAPDSFRGEIMLEAEQLIKGKTIARAGGIYGPDRMRYLSNPTPSPKIVHRIHVADLANFCVCAVATDKVESGIYNLVDDVPSSGDRVIKWLDTGIDSKEEQPERVISNSKLKNTFTLLYPNFKAGYGEALRFP